MQLDQSGDRCKLHCALPECNHATHLNNSCVIFFLAICKLLFAKTNGTGFTLWHKYTGRTSMFAAQSFFLDGQVHKFREAH